MTGGERTALAFEWGVEAPAAHAYLVPPVLEGLRRAGARRVLDLGCGNGTFTVQVVAGGFDVVGIDASRSGIRIAAEIAPSATFLEHALENPLPPELHGQFDAVIAVEVVEHLPVPKLLCARAREALRPGGLFIATTPYHGYLKNLALAVAGQMDGHWQPLQDGGHIKFFSRATLTELLERAGFEVTSVARVGRMPPLAKSMVVASRLKK